jgi:hypothetical protein
MLKNLVTLIVTIFITGIVVVIIVALPVLTIILLCVIIFGNVKACLFPRRIFKKYKL